MLLGFENLLSVFGQFGHMSSVPHLVGQVVDFDKAGAVSELLPAAIQTAGVYAQASVLKAFGPALERIAALCYLVAFCCAIGSVAIYGSYQRGLYFLVGPSLFFFMVKNTAPVEGTQLKMGNKEVRGSIDDQIKFLKKFANAEDYSSGAEVSYFYLAWDNLVSAIVQDVVEVLVDPKSKDDLVFKARERYLSWVLQSMPTSPGFLKLIGMGYFGNCATIFHHIEDLTEEKKNPKKRKVDGNLNPVGEFLLYTYNLLKGAKRLTLDPDVVAFLDGESIQGDYVRKQVSCEDVWNYIGQFTVKFAEGQLKIDKFLSDAPRDEEVPWDRVQEEVRKALSGKVNPDTGKPASKPEDILAAYIIKNSLTKASHQMMVASVFEKVPFNAERHTTIFEDVAGTELFGAYVRIAYFAASIPYIQGLLLYILSLAFPFFAIFLVMPGRATTFFVWMSLWAWVKSWDVGFAMVHVARKVMWQFVSHSTNAYGETVDMTRPETVFSLIGDNDPLAHENTYFQIIALLTTGIPLLTAHFCLGATNLFSAFRMAIDQTANEMGTASARAMRRKLASETESYIDQRRHAAGMMAAKWVYDHAMKDKNGRVINDNGDNSIGIVANMAYEKGKMDWDFSEEGVAAKARLSALTTRTSNFYYGHGQQYLKAYSSYLAMSFTGVKAGEGHVLGDERAPIWISTPGFFEAPPVRPNTD